MRLCDEHTYIAYKRSSTKTPAWIRRGGLDDGVGASGRGIRLFDASDIVTHAPGWHTNDRTSKCLPRLLFEGGIDASGEELVFCDARTLQESVVRV